MITFFTGLIILIIIVPVIPLLLYVIGLLLPASHIVSRTATFQTTQAHLWEILTDVRRYPEWQSRLERVVLIEQDDKKRVVFEEYTKRKRRIFVNHIEQQPMSRLLRILEEQTTASTKKVPSFSGSWTFELSVQHFESRQTTTLRITQQGIIKKPMVRVSYMLLVGFHRKIDIFLRDLAKKIERDAAEEIKAASITNPLPTNSDTMPHTHSTSHFERRE